MIRRLKQKKGFSLIELLIVIAIIGIIATIAIPLLLSARNNAIDEKGRNSLRSLISAEAAYYAKHGNYGGLTDLQSDVDGVAFIDERLATNADDHFTVTLTTDGVTYDATVTTDTGQVYTADETGEIIES